ncbi:MAG TPA: ATP-binding protein [Rhizomicrobium sp.]|jgi:signal transduction histidine kinase/HPt (histidine-containing phosphotransfer) domain-containing protein|nr:ATP-binding protein [Rhizomicrobium sp.]
MSVSEALPEQDARAQLAMRVENLYTIGRAYLSLPFTVFCLPAAFLGGKPNALQVLAPLVLQIIAIVVGENVRHAYLRRASDKSADYWARRYVAASAVSGASWGLSAIIWFVPNSFPAEAYLSLAFLGMTSAELIGRCAYRPAFATHVFFSLTPLIILLLLQDNLLATMSAVVIIFFAALLFGYCGLVGSFLDRSARLKEHKTALIDRLSLQKEAAEKARDAAELGARAKSAFVANISHEIRTPLNALLGMAQLLDRAGLEKQHRDYVKVMLEAGRGLRLLLDDVIALSSEEANTDKHGDCDPSQTARAVVQLLQPRAWEKQLRLTLSVASGLPRAGGDPRRIRQVLLKLAENALKFTDRGGVEILVEATENANGTQGVKFSVTDTGLGIPSEVAAHLFQPFTPGDASYARHHAGAGLGLAVAKRIIDSLDGEIGFESEPGQGSTFWFALPVVSTSAADRDHQAQGAQDAEPPSDLTLLAYITDYGAHRQFVRYLEPFGNRIIFAQTLADAAARAAREDFDAIVARASDIETLASSPGAGAPMLAILFPGDKPPESGDEVLYWPAPSNEVYAVLRKVTARKEEIVPPPPKEVAAIDAPAFAALEKSLGFATLVEILQSYIKTTETLCNSLSKASAEEDWAEAARLAQDIAGAAGGLGLGAMTTAARGFAQQARVGEDSHALRNAAQMVVGEHVRVRNALTNLYPDLAA